MTRICANQRQCGVNPPASVVERSSGFWPTDGPDKWAG